MDVVKYLFLYFNDEYFSIILQLNQFFRKFIFNDQQLKNKYILYKNAYINIIKRTYPCNIITVYIYNICNIITVYIYNIYNMGIKRENIINMMIDNLTYVKNIKFYNNTIKYTTYTKELIKSIRIVMDFHNLPFDIKTITLINQGDNGICYYNVLRNELS
jgi:hypothetical protein